LEFGLKSKQHLTTTKILAETRSKACAVANKLYWWVH
jgi:hypothetical protein